jgi:hypothetical protein
MSISRPQGKAFAFIITEYNLPIFLMHTIFAAGLRNMMMKVWIDNVIIHVEGE